ncbi:MAG: type II toxin-antitoxin system RelB/DinJ family antitoxin [Fibrobacter sp.]|uniref:type II toxin-antitoxin system RelB/DinJ family antitoxin n=1 Tax=Fibrobacter sp. TaxID=35828 RepID=UPI0025C070A4|nr:type II toxin-antitoxin system RelB/DinJ family antitoxin [Fibrobacter sp.]MBQ2561564.1 type II toxin-antitoxin system RelB/DinJ family antitoxin [Fibrobacter sp.]MBR4784787.1 type II toxin-antitoxin system RelB/DinJ family antitoxin [Fibrobacter sp.]
MANLTISLDDEDKKSITKFCDRIGITVSGLYNVFTKQVLREGRIPFEIGVEVHNHIAVNELNERP